MKTRTLVVATGDYLHTRGLDGVTLADEFVIRHVLDKPSQVFADALSASAPYDVAEASLATTWMLAAAQDTRFVPLPVFTSRMFRWSSLYMRADTAPLQKREPLHVGMIRYGQTAAVWARSHLREAMPVGHPQPHWWIAQRQPWVPDSLPLHEAEDLPALEQMLVDKKLDVLISTRLPAAFESGRVTRLFADWAVREQQALQAGHSAPVMHTLLLRRTLLDDAPGLARDVLRLFERVRDQAWAWLIDTDKSGLPVPSQHAWLAGLGATATADSVWPYRLDANRSVLARFARLMHEQGLTPELITPEQVFGHCGAL